MQNLKGTLAPFIKLNPNAGTTPPHENEDNENKKGQNTKPKARKRSIPDGTCSIENYLIKGKQKDLAPQIKIDGGSKQKVKVIEENNGKVVEKKALVLIDHNNAEIKKNGVKSKKTTKSKSKNSDSSPEKESSKKSEKMDNLDPTKCQKCGGELKIEDSPETKDQSPSKLCSECLYFNKENTMNNSRKQIKKAVAKKLKKPKTPEELAKYEILKIFAESYPELVKNKRIVYPIEDSLLRAMPDLHDFVEIPKPIVEPVPGGEKNAADLLEIWNFCKIFKTMIGVSNFTVTELYNSMNSNNEEDGFLMTYLVQSFIDAFVKDVKEFTEKELYSTFAILFLEMSDYLYAYPIESIGLLFRVKKYKKCISQQVFDQINSLISAYELQKKETRFSKLEFLEKKEILLSLVRALCTSVKAKDYVTRNIQDSKDFKMIEKQKLILEKEIQPYKGETNPPQELTAEKKKEIAAKQREINKLENALKKKVAVQTQKIGMDANNVEYWTFSGDKEHLYVRTFNESDGKEIWGFYSTQEQFDKLMNSLCEKGILEKKLKDNLQKLAPHMRFIEPIQTEEKKEELKKEDEKSKSNQNENLSYKDRLRGKKKKNNNKKEIIMHTFTDLVKYLLEIEEKYQGFYNERSLSWEASPSKRLTWRTKGEECKEIVTLRKWMLEFAINSMNPNIVGPIPKSIKNAVRDTQDYEFDLDNENESQNDENSDDESHYSLRGVIWKDLGKDAFDKWFEYAKTTKNVNELMLACKLLNRLFEESFNFIEDIEHEKIASNNGERKAKLNCIRRMRKNEEESEDILSSEDYEESPKKEDSHKNSDIEWGDECYICGEGGNLLCCDTCPNVVHLECVGLKSTPTGMWQCEACRNKSVNGRTTRSKAKRLQKINEYYEE